MIGSLMPPRREWRYVQEPLDYEIAGCPCGDPKPEWSEFQGLLWCPTCKLDFKPEHGGVFDGPIPVAMSHLLGVCYSRINLATGELEKLDCCLKWEREP